MKDFYRFLAQAMRYPDAAWFTAEFAGAFLALVDLTGRPVPDGLADLLQADDVVEQLQIEHTRLFINAVPTVPAPPYASAHLDGLLMGTAAEQALLFYRQHGYEPRDSADPPDGLVTELEFLALVSDDEQVEEEFLAGCFRPWFGTFREKVITEARLPYYPAAVSLIDFFTQEDIA